MSSLRKLAKGPEISRIEFDKGEIVLKCTKQFSVVCLLCLLILTACSQEGKIVRRDIRFADDEPGVVGVMTFNVRYGAADDGENHWDHRKEILFDVMAEHGADVIGLQEALSFQIRQIKRALPGYKVITAGRDDGQQGGEACPILYRGDRYRAADSGTFWFSNMPWKPGSKHWGNRLPRICTWARLTEIATGESFFVYNLHLDHQSQESRQYSLELLAKEILKREPTGPVIVMGDFNMDTDNAAMAALPMTDVWRFLHPNGVGVTTYHAFGDQPEGPFLDHILIDEAIKIIEVAIDIRAFAGRYPSDHFPVIARLRVNDTRE